MFTCSCHPCSIILFVYFLALPSLLHSTICSIDCYYWVRKLGKTMLATGHNTIARSMCNNSQNRPPVAETTRDKLQQWWTLATLAPHIYPATAFQVTWSFYKISNMRRCCEVSNLTDDLEWSRQSIKMYGITTNAVSLRGWFSHSAHARQKRTLLGVCACADKTRWIYYQAAFEQTWCPLDYIKDKPLKTVS